MGQVKLIKQRPVVSSGARVLGATEVKYYSPGDGVPRLGDLVYGRVTSIGKHTTIENTAGRIQGLGVGTRAIFVYGNRYAPDAYEGLVPEQWLDRVDILARSGMVGRVTERPIYVKRPTRVKILGRIVNAQGVALNTLDLAARLPVGAEKEKGSARARMVLSIGTAMNSGKTTTAQTCVWALSSLGYEVTGSKITGTANLKEILAFEDSGAVRSADFSSFGYPSTYRIGAEAAIDLFEKLDAQCGGNPDGYWVVEIADGIFQEETAALLSHPGLRDRIFRLVFSARDACGALGGIQVLRDRFGLTPDLVSGRCTGSPLMLRELRDNLDIPVMVSGTRELKRLRPYLAPRSKSATARREGRSKPGKS